MFKNSATFQAISKTNKKVAKSLKPLRLNCHMGAVTVNNGPPKIMFPQSKFPGK